MTIVKSIFSVFTDMIDWFTTSLGTVSEMFYSTDTGLTLFGTLSVIGLGMGFVFLLVNTIRRMLRLR